jgi:carotenoid 1,2-hydratase
MTAVPLLTHPSSPDAWHQVRSPGGYEWWYFDAEDVERQLRFVAILFDGYVFHPQYLRRYERYRRWPTLFAPPVAREYACASFAVYERDQAALRWIRQYPPGSLRAATDALDVVLGPNTCRAAQAGTMELSISGHEFTFRPMVGGDGSERRLADHRWFIASPSCEVEGRLRVGEHVDFRGSGYHDHSYGTQPIGFGIQRWFRGRVLLEGNPCVAFHCARPRDRRLPDEISLIEADASGMRELDVGEVEVDWSARSRLLLAFPRQARFGSALQLSGPRVIDSSPFSLRILYDAEVGARRGTALCEVVYPNRLLWPVLGRAVERGIEKCDS